MKLAEYLRARNETQTDFSARSGVPQAVISRACNGEIPIAANCKAIIRASREEPTPDGGVVTWDDMVPDEAA